MRYLALCFLIFIGCSSPSVTHFKGLAHTHSYHIQVEKNLSSKQKKEIQNLIDKTFEDIDNQFNHWNPHSALSLVNQGWDSTPEVNKILALAMHYKDLTEGFFDPLLGGVISAWKESLKKGECPLLNNVQAEIDLDGMLKGYTIDLLIEKLSALGHKNIYVEWGGDIRVLGQHPNKRPWRILVGEKIVELKGAIATSGNKEQQWMIGNQAYTHIIDPQTLNALKIEKEMSVSVSAPTCAFADALATACMAIGNSDTALKWAKKIKKNNKDVDFWIITKP